MVAERGAAERAPPSPCIGICLIDPATRHCRGCSRSIEEIAIWYAASVAEKHVILARVAARRAAESSE